MSVCTHIREVGIGCKIPPGTTKVMDNNRTAIIKLLITCFSEALYHSPTGMYVCMYVYMYVCGAWWCSGLGFGLMIHGSWVRVPPLADEH